MALVRSIGRSVRRGWRISKWRCLRWLFVTVGVPALAGDALGEQPTLGPFEAPRPVRLSVPLGEELFDPREALNGSISSREHCVDVPGGLWVEVEGRGDCIRYYQHGLKEPTVATALVYFGGDVMLRMPNGVRYVSSSYRSQSPSTIEAGMTEWSTDAGVPAIHLARPGIYGSSGDHNARRHRREIDLMDRALDMLKERYAISSFILTGHSAGGQIVAALLNRRLDVSAAIITSGLVSVRQVAAHWEDRRKIPGRVLYDAKAFYDPVDDLDNIPRDPAPEIYVISDPEDRSVPFYSQLYYVRRLRSLGFEPQHIYARAPAPLRHLLASHGKRAAALVAKGKSAADIRRALLELELEERG